MGALGNLRGWGARGALGNLEGWGTWGGVLGDLGVLGSLRGGVFGDPGAGLWGTWRCWGGGSLRDLGSP